MKKISALFSISLLSLLFIPAIAQTDFRWADSNAVWYHTYHLFGNGYLKAIYTKDTSLNGQSCQKISLYHQEKYFTSPDSTAVTPLDYYGCYYLYKSHDSVFTYRNNNFYLAFKTDGNVGEIWDLGVFYTFTDLHAYVMVDSVFYQNYNGELLRNIKIHACDSIGNNVPSNPGSSDTLLFAAIADIPVHNTIINEKFGPIGGFDAINIAYLNVDNIEFIPSLLRCYESATFPFYQSNPSFDCFNNIFTGIEKTELSNGFNLSPNPFSQSTNISFSQTYNDIALEVYNLEGQLVAQNHYENSNEIVFERKGLCEGLYFLKLTLDGKRVETRKMVVRE